MNIKRAKHLAEILEHGDLPAGVARFDMRDFSTIYGYIPFSAEEKEHCGTTCCIGGLICWLWGAPGDRICSDNAAELLDLEEGQACRLFYNHDDYISTGYFYSITMAEAAAAIRRIIAEEEANDE